MAWSRDPRKPTRYMRGSKRYNDVGGHSPPGDELENTRDHERIWFELKRTRSCCDCDSPGFKYCFDTFDYPGYICDGEFPGGDTMVGYWPGQSGIESSSYCVFPGCTPDEIRAANLVTPVSHDAGSWRNGPYSDFTVGSEGWQGNFQSAGFNWENFFPNHDRTLEAWIKPSATDISNGREFIKCGLPGAPIASGGISAFFRSNGAMAFQHIEIDGGALQESPAGWWEADQWHHFVMVRNAATNSIAFFINGRLAISRVLPSTGWTTATFPTIPNLVIQWASWADIAYYTSALSPAVIRKHYNSVYGVEGVANPAGSEGVSIEDPTTVITESITIDLIDGGGAGHAGDIVISQGDFADYVSPEDSPFELEARKGVASGYAELDSSALLPLARIGTSGTPSKTSFLRGDRKWQDGQLVQPATDQGQILVSGGGQDSTYYRAAVLADTPGGYWPLDEAGIVPANLNDIGSWGRDLFAVGDANSPAASSAFPELFLGETTLQFDGSGDYVRYGDSVSGSIYERDDWAMSGWFYFDSIGACELMVEGKFSSFPFGMRVTAAGKLEMFNVYGAQGFTLTGTTTLETGRWYHLACERLISTTTKLYIDGVTEATGTGGFSYAPDLEFRVGDSFVGRIGHIAFWVNDPRTAGWAATHHGERARRWTPSDPASLGIAGGVEVDKNDSDVTAAARGRLNFIEGSGVTLTVADDAANDEVDITIAASAGVEVDKNDVDVTAAKRGRLNFVEGANISLTVTDDGANDEVDITIAATAPAGAGIEVDKNDVDVTAAPRGRLNFIEGSNITLTVADDAANDEVDITIGASGGGSGEAVMRDIAATAHGFSVGDVIYYTGSAYALADADTEGGAEVLGIVQAVADANNFTVLVSGYIDVLSGLTAGTTYFLSATAGDLTDTPPSTVGQVIKPLLIATSATAGYFFNWKGELITAGDYGFREHSHVESTANVTVSSTTEAGANTVLTAGPVTYDGLTEVEIEFFCPRVDIGASAGSWVVFNLWDGSTDLGRIAVHATASQVFAASGKRVLTPSAGSHSYIIKAWRVNSDGTVYHSSAQPFFLRITSHGPLGAMGTGVLPAPSLAFPASPTNGQVALITDSLTAPTYEWMFRYDSGISDANKWVFIGGSPARVKVDTSETTTSTSYVDLATVGPSFTAPCAGVYRAAHGALQKNSVVASVVQAVKWGASATANADWAYCEQTAWVSVSAHREGSVAAGNLVIKCQYSVTAGTGSWQSRWLEVTPVRVAG